MYMIRLFLFAVIWYTQLVYEIDVVLIIALTMFAIERYMNFMIGGNENVKF
jgi:hypothetical protein